MVFSKYNFSLCDKRGRHIFDQDAESSEDHILILSQYTNPSEFLQERNLGM